MTISPGRYIDTDAVYHASVVHGAITLHPSLVATGDTVYAAGVGRQVVMSRHSDSDTFGATTITVGPVSVLPSFHDSDDTFGVVTMEVAVLSHLFNDVDTLTPPFLVHRRKIRSNTAVIAGVFEDVDLIGSRDA